MAVASRGLLRLLLRRAREGGRNTRFVLVVGDGPSAREYARRIERYPYLGLRIAGFLADPGPDEPRPGVSASARAAPLRAPALAMGTLGRIHEIDDVLRSRIVDEVAICLAPEDGAFVEPIARLCEEQGLVVRIPLFEGISALPGGRLEDFDGIRIQSVAYGPDRTLSLVAKRADRHHRRAGRTDPVHASDRRRLDRDPPRRAGADPVPAGARGTPRPAV